MRSVPACPKLKELFPRSRIGVESERTPVYGYVAGQGNREHPRQAEAERRRPAIRDKGHDRSEREEGSRHERAGHLPVTARDGLLGAHVGLVAQLAERRM